VVEVEPETEQETAQAGTAAQILCKKNKSLEKIQAVKIKERRGWLLQLVPMVVEQTSRGETGI